MNLTLRKIVLVSLTGVMLSACAHRQRPVPVEPLQPTSIPQGGDDNNVYGASQQYNAPYQPTYQQAQPMNYEAIPVPTSAQTPRHRGSYIPSNAPVDLSQPTHTVVYGDTVYNIAKRYNISQTQLRAWNRLAGNTIHIGQVLKVRGYGSPTSSGIPLAPSNTIPVQQSLEPIQTVQQIPPPVQQQNNIPVQHYTPEQYANYQPASNSGNNGSFRAEPMNPNSQLGQKVVSASPLRTVGGVTWMRPVNGAIIQQFSKENKSIVFGGHMGMPIYAAAAGRVVWSGESPTLRGYGRLIIIQHNKEYLSAYGNNQSLLVHTGDTVSLGQQIATMGNTDSQERVQLLFEVRRNGTPVNPMDYLPYK